MNQYQRAAASYLVYRLANRMFGSERLGVRVDTGTIVYFNGKIMGNGDIDIEEEGVYHKIMQQHISGDFDEVIVIYRKSSGEEIRIELIKQTKDFKNFYGTAWHNSLCKRFEGVYYMGDRYVIIRDEEEMNATMRYDIL